MPTAKNELPKTSRKKLLHDKLGFTSPSRQKRKACLYRWLMPCLSILVMTLRTALTAKSSYVNSNQQSALFAIPPELLRTRAERDLSRSAVMSRRTSLRPSGWQKNVTPTSTIWACCPVQRRSRKFLIMTASLTRRLITPRLLAHGTSLIVELPTSLTSQNKFLLGTLTIPPTQKRLKRFKICNI